MTKSFFATAAVASTIVAVLTGPAMADANLVSSTPEANATVSEAPQQIELQFSEVVRLNLSKISVTGPRGSMETTVGQDQNDKSLVFVSFWSVLRPGTYTVNWSVASSGIDRTQGRYTFIVKS